MGLSTERIGQYDVTPLPNGKYSVALNNGNIGAYQTDIEGVNKIRKEYEALSPQEKAALEANATYPLLERSPQKDTVSFSGDSENKTGMPAKKKGLLATLAVLLAGAGAFLLTKCKVKPQVAESAVKTATEVTKPAEKAATVIKETVPKTAEKVVQNGEKAATVVSEKSIQKTAEQVAQTTKSKGYKIVEKESKKGQTVAEDVLNPKAKNGKSVEEVLGAERELGHKAAYEEMNTARVFEEEVPIYNRGSYGQDIMDPCNPLNQHDMLSPYYTPPFSDPLNPIGGFGPDPMNGGMFGGMF